MIVVDDREAKEAEEHQGVSIPYVLGIPCTIDRLTAGDYAFLGRGNGLVGIERSEIGNLIQKLRSGELESQLLRCQETYSSIILLVEGVYDQIDKLLATYNLGNRGYFRTHVYPSTEYGFIMALLVRLSELGIEVIHTPNFLCSMTTISTIYHQRTKPEEEHTLFKKTRAIRIPTKLTSNPTVPRLMALFPRLSEKVAIRLINKYGSIWSILNTEDSELLEVEGFGKGLLSKLKEGIGKE